MAAPHRVNARLANTIQGVQELTEAQQEQLDRIEAKLDAVLSALDELNKPARKPARKAADDGA